MEQLAALSIIPGHPNSTTKAFADLKEELARETVTLEITQTEVETLNRAVSDLKISADKLAAQIPILEEKVKHLDNKVMDGLTELRARELCLERTAKTNDDFRSPNAKLAKKLESKLPWSFCF
jgi:uncharacterized coiled-coil protein SlyX